MAYQTMSLGGILELVPNLDRFLVKSVVITYSVPSSLKQAIMPPDGDTDILRKGPLSSSCTTAGAVASLRREHGGSTRART